MHRAFESIPFENSTQAIFSNTVMYQQTLYHFSSSQNTVTRIALLNDQER